MTAPVTTRLSQADADREVWEFLARVSRIANSASFVDEVEYAFIDSAYLSRSGFCHAIGIAVRVRRKPRCGGERASPLREAFRRRRIRRALQDGGPHLAIRWAEGLSGSDTPFAILYQAPGAKPPAGTTAATAPSSAA